jgi:transcription antitermination factor NusG
VKSEKVYLQRGNRNIKRRGMTQKTGRWQKKKPEESRREFNVGEQVRVKLRTGETVDATIKAVTTKTKSVRLQVDHGKDETALIYDLPAA